MGRKVNHSSSYSGMKKEKAELFCGSGIIKIMFCALIVFSKEFRIMNNFFFVEVGEAFCL